MNLVRQTGKYFPDFSPSTTTTTRGVWRAERTLFPPVFSEATPARPASLLTMSTLTLPLRNPAFALKLPNALHVARSLIRGEVLLDYGRALDDHVERVFIELHGTIQT